MQKYAMILRKSFYKTSVDTTANFHVYNYAAMFEHEKKGGDRIESFYYSRTCRIRDSDYPSAQ